MVVLYIFVSLSRLHFVTLVVVGQHAKYLMHSNTQCETNTLANRRFDVFWRFKQYQRWLTQWNTSFFQLNKTHSATSNVSFHRERWNRTIYTKNSEISFNSIQNGTWTIEIPHRMKQCFNILRESINFRFRYNHNQRAHTKNTC